jgi:uncharacterized protein YprB with RNaseH-like and TPR domain
MGMLTSFSNIFVTPAVLQARVGFVTKSVLVIFNGVSHRAPFLRRSRCTESDALLELAEMQALKTIARSATTLS